MQKGYAWDLATRSGALPDKGAQIVVHEFDYKQENEVVYQENGVTIRSWPAIHSLDGSVSYSLEWNGLKYVFGGDTYPNKWYMEVRRQARTWPRTSASFRQRRWPRISAGTWLRPRMCRRESTPSRQAFGKVMSAVKPRMAVGYHSVQSPENNAAIMEEVRKTYDGPLTIARDLMVINVTKDDIVVRMATVDEYVLPPDVTEAYKKAPRTDEKNPSAEIEAGRWKGYTPPPMPKRQ